MWLLNLYLGWSMHLHNIQLVYVITPPPPHTHTHTQCGFFRKKRLERAKKDAEGEFEVRQVPPEEPAVITGEGECMLSWQLSARSKEKSLVTVILQLMSRYNSFISTVLLTLVSSFVSSTLCRQKGWPRRGRGTLGTLHRRCCWSWRKWRFGGGSGRRTWERPRGDITVNPWMVDCRFSDWLF